MIRVFSLAFLLIFAAQDSPLLFPFNTSLGRAFSPFRKAGGILHVGDEPARLSLDPATPVGTRVYQNNDATIYQLNAPSTAITGQFVNGAATTEVNGVYSKRGTSGGKDYYNQLGQTTDTTTYSIVWGALGGILGTGWGINGSGAVLDYYSLDAVSRPDQVTTWVSVNVDQVPTVTSVQTGELVAGVKITGAGTGSANDIFTINPGTYAEGRLVYVGFASGVLQDPAKTGWQFNASDPQSSDAPAFPWQATGWTDSATVIRDDVASTSNWSVVP